MRFLGYEWRISLCGWGKQVKKGEVTCSIANWVVNSRVRAKMQDFTLQVESKVSWTIAQGFKHYKHPKLSGGIQSKGRVPKSCEAKQRKQQDIPTYFLLFVPLTLKNQAKLQRKTFSLSWSALLIISELPQRPRFLANETVVISSAECYTERSLLMTSGQNWSAHELASFGSNNHLYSANFLLCANTDRWPQHTPGFQVSLIRGNVQNSNA